MRRLIARGIALCLLTVAAAHPVYGDQVQYYIWEDENGVTQMSDSPPKDRDYETRTIDYEAGSAPPPASAASDERRNTATKDETSGRRDSTRSSSSRTPRDTDSTSGFGKATIIRQTPDAGQIEGVPGIPGAGISSGAAGP